MPKAPKAKGRPNTQARSTSPPTARARVKPPSQPHTELFIALVGPIGTDLRGVAQELANQLRSYEYRSRRIGLSDFLPSLTWSSLPDVPEDIARGIRSDDPYDERVWALMTAGDSLRGAWQHSGALALLAVSTVEDIREEIERAKAAEEGREPVEDQIVGWPTVERHAYIFRSVKTAGEVATFREVYGPRFFLIGAHCSEQKRIDNLESLIRSRRRNQSEKDWKYAPSQLIDRDWREEVRVSSVRPEARHKPDALDPLAGLGGVAATEEIPAGQDVSGTFHQSDFFVDAEDPTTMRRDIARTLRMMFGHPHETPTRDEYSMFQAAGAARRSAELGRQVGAAIATESGSVIALGTNEVPAFGGGSYWADYPTDPDGKPLDAREYTKDVDTNYAWRKEITDDVEFVVAQELLATAETEQIKIARDEMTRLEVAFRTRVSRSVMAETGIRELTEFGRATHAEMSAILDAARRGLSVQDASLFVTTFPCHGCARSIIESGIKRVVYIEPYAKSKALKLHDDAIELARSRPTPPWQDKVRFQPFVGVSPRRYLALFDAPFRESLGYLPRRSSKGVPTRFEAFRRVAVPIFTDIEGSSLRPTAPMYKHREGRVLDLLQEKFRDSGVGPSSENYEGVRESD